jgi:type IV secretion system protein VirB6
MGIGEEVEKALDFLLMSLVTSKSAAMCTALLPIAITGATIYLLVMGFAIMRGEANDPLHTFVWKSFRMALIAGIALSAGEYQTTIAAGTEALVGAFLESMSGFTSVGAVVDDIAKPFSDLGQQIWNQAVTGFWPNFALIAAAGAVAVAEFLMFAIGLGFFLLAKVALALVLAVGPAFILCAMWPGTEKYTESWLGQVLNYVVLKVLVAACILMLTDFASKFAAHIQVTTDTVNVLKATTSLVCCSGALVIVMLNLPQLAAALSGGASISGIGRTIGRALLDVMNRPRKDKSSPAGGEISQARGRGQGTGPAPPPRKPLYQRNTIERLKNAS